MSDPPTRCLEAFHQSDCERIVGGPEAGDDGFSAVEQKGSLETLDPFFAQQFPTAHLACR